MYTCTFCGRACNGRILPHGYCQSCYNYFDRFKKKLWPIPQKGVVGRTPDGEVICPYCGKGVDDLATHCRFSHQLSHRELCDEQGYNYRQSLVSLQVANKLSRLAKHYKMDEQLKKVGKSTRIQKGQTLRLGYPDREQASLLKKKRIKI
jgi:hypothetical protein